MQRDGVESSSLVQVALHLGQPLYTQTFLEGLQSQFAFPSSTVLTNSALNQELLHKLPSSHDPISWLHLSEGLLNAVVHHLGIKVFHT